VELPFSMRQRRTALMKLNESSIVRDETVE